MLGSDARVKVKIRRGVDVTAHRRALLFRAGAVSVLATSALLSIPGAAFAAGPNVTATASNVSLTVGGGAQPVNVSIKNTGDDDAPSVVATIDIAGDTGATVVSDSL